MTKEGLVEALVSKLNLSKKDATEAVRTVFESIEKSLSKGEEVTVSGFGTFRVRHRKARMGVNPRTGAKIQVPAMKVPKFSAGKGLKEAVK